MKLLKLFFSLALFLIIVPNYGHANEYVVTRDFCEFEITVPGEPVTQRMCSDVEPNRCKDVTTFTHVFGLDSTVNFMFSCSKGDSDTIEKYTEDIMRAVIASHVASKRLDEYQTDYQLSENIKKAFVIGSGVKGQSQLLYLAQIWVGASSILTLEGEVIGEAFEDADRMFSEIINSTRLKGNPDNAPANEEPLNEIKN
jgi:hypothetical protein